MTVHLRQPLPPAKFDSLIEEALVPVQGQSVYRDGVKRCLDVVLVLLAALPVLILLLPILLMIARDGQSPLYCQKRIGRNGKTFNMWKLRSMVPDADSLLEAYLDANPAARVEWTRDQKLRQDPRITPIGRIIRKTSIDELPQLFNVLRGDMSLVGPRPMMVDQQALYPGTAYYALRPGVTGFWQTSVRNETSFADRARFDSDYMRKLSFLTDLSVLLRTVKVVIRGTGC